MEPLIVNSLFVGVYILVAVTVVFFLSRIWRDNSIMDIAYGPIYLIAIGGGLLTQIRFDLLPIVITACITLWAARLGIRILLKNIGKPEDERYAKWRKQWLQKGKVYFWIRSYLQISILQGVIIFVVALPGIIALAYSENSSHIFLYAGLAVFFFGLCYETLADWQLDQFIARKKAGTEPATLMTTGLFAYSRRPNYFGETLIWWGLAIMVLPLPYGWLALLSPLTITYIVTKVTGPMLEQNFLEKYPEEYRAYMTSTNYFFPGPTRD